MTRAPRSAHAAALDTVQCLRAGGFRSLFAGGCVRDRLMGRTPKDYDVATDATPDAVLRLFPGARAVGAKFGVVLVRRYGFDIEVATFRSDGQYSDGRHPDQVIFGTEIDDAQRRDFTINGLFFDPVDEKIIDHVGGRADMDARLLRTIGDPDRRFGEDHLRMLRAVRFAAELSFVIDAGTFAAMRRHADRLLTISPERVWMELSKILAGPRRSRGWQLLVQAGLRPYLAEDWSGDPVTDQETAQGLDRLPHEDRPPTLGLAAAMLDVLTMRGPEVPEIGSPHRPALVPSNIPPAGVGRPSLNAALVVIRARCRSLRLSNAEMDAVQWLISSLPLVRDPDRLELADLKLLLRNVAWPHLMELLAADLATRRQDVAPVGVLTDRAAAIPPDAIAAPPFITGDELISAGRRPGPELGELLRGLTRAQLNEEIRTKSEAWAWVENHSLGLGIDKHS